MKIAAIQMNSSDDPNANLEKTKSLVSEAQSEGAKICFLPENFAFMGHPRELLNSVMEDKDSGPIQDAISQLARDEKVWIIAGSIPIKDLETGKSLSRSITFNDVGDVVGYYDKIHLFDVEVDGKKYHESQVYSPGKNPKVVPTPWFRIGLSICYDLRFPELYRSSELKDVELISVPSAFTKETGEAHWLTLLRSRAIENLAFIVAANQWGKHYGARETFGNSVIIDPWGRIMDIKEEGEGLVTADIDIQELKSIRRKFPALNHREIYT